MPRPRRLIFHKNRLVILGGRAIPAAAATPPCCGILAVSARNNSRYNTFIIRLDNNVRKTSISSKESSKLDSMSFRCNSRDRSERDNTTPRIVLEKLQAMKEVPAEPEEIPKEAENYICKG
ncbi:hypothetical protein V6N12_075149 [Hibiscus sabdariffa]|uniref:Uncharacterized protein n=1 Tax=Hibiscus sabdariffa TaxID=183260 RepID=A0ABR2C135_9ROSI